MIKIKLRDLFDHSGAEHGIRPGLDGHSGQVLDGGCVGVGHTIHHWCIC